MIAGWVALWRPLEIFLYDWWPIRAEARLQDRLAEMDVRVIGVAPAAQRIATHDAGPGAGRGIPDSPRRTAVVRGLAFLALWLVLMPSTKPGDLVIGLLSAAAATWVSLRLLPPATGCLNFDALLLLAPHFLWESVKAGIDVARRALAPRLRLAPGFVSCPLDFPPGLRAQHVCDDHQPDAGTGAVAAKTTTRSSITASTPRQPVVEQLWKEERLLSRALVAGRRHD